MTRISTICVMGSALALAAMSTSSASALVLNEHSTTPATNVLPNVTNNNKVTTQQGTKNLNIGGGSKIQNGSKGQNLPAVQSQQNIAGGSKIQNGSKQNLVPAVQQALPGTQ